MTHWTTDLLGLHEAVDFIENWWPTFLLAPLAITPVLVLLALPRLGRETEGKKRKTKREGTKTKRRRSITRRLFVDDTVGMRKKRPVGRLFFGTLFAATTISILIFIGLATVMVIRAFILVNDAELHFH